MEEERVGIEETRRRGETEMGTGSNFCRDHHRSAIDRIDHRQVVGLCRTAESYNPSRVIELNP